jgi:hypothetical protein
MRFPEVCFVNPCRMLFNYLADCSRFLIKFFTLHNLVYLLYFTAAARIFYIFDVRGLVIVVNERT